MTSSLSAATAQQAPAGRLSRSAHASGQEPGTTVTVSEATDERGAVTSLVRRTVLPGGLRVVTEQMAGVRSASIGVFVQVGSADEDPVLHGCSHFLEHLLFKGTAERTALDISVALDAVGGDFNAFTAKEYTCYHARVLDTDLPVAVDVIGDMLTSSTITDEDVEAEREVILDEIAMHDDDAEDVAHNLFAAQAWGETGWGRSIAGTEESIRALSRDQVADFYAAHYRAANMVVAVAGNVRHEAVVALVERAFARAGFLDSHERPRGPFLTSTTQPVTPGEVRVRKGFEQVTAVLGVNGLTRSDERRFVLGVLNTALGGGTSSRLFQEVREKRGLAYSVYSFGAHHADAGVVGVGVGCLPSKVDEVLRVVREELARVAREGISADEVERGKSQLRGGLLLGLEDSASRMARIGKAELLHDEFLEVDDVIERIDAVTPEAVHELARELFGQPEVLVLVGPGQD